MIFFSKFMIRFGRVNILMLFLGLGAVLISCNKKDNYDPDKYLNSLDKDKFVSAVIRYSVKPPEGVNDEMKFDPKYNAYYLDKASRVKLERYYPVKDEIFFLLSQPAPSLTEKRNATGGLAKFSDDGKLIQYEEVFRTWKMIPDTLKVRSYFLFDKMVKGESLEPYLTKSAGDQYIEFPDDKVFYDVENRRWTVRSVADSLQAN
jgi:hypothetical protein